MHHCLSYHLVVQCCVRALSCSRQQQNVLQPAGHTAVWLLLVNLVCVIGHCLSGSGIQNITLAQFATACDLRCLRNSEQRVVLSVWCIPLAGPHRVGLWPCLIGITWRMAPSVMQKPDAAGVIACTCSELVPTNLCHRQAKPCFMSIQQTCNRETGTCNCTDSQRAARFSSFCHMWTAR